ncbi:uncharacterized protein Bfra_007589 [Botrytis fragariae]|uniref:Uncharacterized protein n=1 Tax=Botrytis fragariae TaxID=1964551 RepID=A0A8H6AP81_9HELO|nr:uncharacterized protein Bfra_007589 [Botrytis fragariae]KAF5871077.1 hypothetical protein Bfra_007589 [Botrytis fragariae]
MSSKYVQDHHSDHEAYPETVGTNIVKSGESCLNIINDFAKRVVVVSDMVHLIVVELHRVTQLHGVDSREPFDR